VGQHVLPPGGFHRGLEGEDQHPAKAQLPGQLVGGEGLAEAHLAVPQELGHPARALGVHRAVVGGGQVHGLLLLGAHFEGPGAVFRVQRAAAHGDHRGPHVVHPAAEPLAAGGLHALAPKHGVNVPVREGAAVRVHGALPEEYAVGDLPVRALGGVLLGHPPVHVHRREAHLQAARIGHVGIGVDHGVGGGTEMRQSIKGIRHFYHHHLNPLVALFSQLSQYHHHSIQSTHRASDHSRSHENPSTGQI